jgi:hypothetical protein
LRTQLKSLQGPRKEPMLTPLEQELLSASEELITTLEEANREDLSHAKEVYYKLRLGFCISRLKGAITQSKEIRQEFESSNSHLS